MSWVSANEPYWVHQHIESYANIAGPTLGVPKAISSLLSGPPPVQTFQNLQVWLKRTVLEVNEPAQVMSKLLE